MQRIRLEGNNGGDYINLSQTTYQANKNVLFIEVGHCCVVMLRAEIPVEFLTSLISKFMLTGVDGNSRSSHDELKSFAEEVLDYNKGYVQELLTKINMI